jgi:uncharacterized membrane protein HdeD (DUF308 family)
MIRSNPNMPPNTMNQNDHNWPWMYWFIDLLLYIILFYYLLLSYTFLSFFHTHTLSIFLIS